MLGGFGFLAVGGRAGDDSRRGERATRPYIRALHLTSAGAGGRAAAGRRAGGRGEQ